MSIRRFPGEIVIRRPGSCFCGSADQGTQYVRLTDPVVDGDMHHISELGCFVCEDPDCREWANVQVLTGPYAGDWLCHLSECEMQTFNGPGGHVRMLSAPPDLGGRVETGPVRIGDDWVGLFIRGDSAGALARELERLLCRQPQLEGFQEKLALDHLRSLIELLKSTDEGVLYGRR